jgi:hypothetical protein
MAQPTRFHDPFHMKARYALVAAFGFAMCALCFAMIGDRRDLEPLVRLLHPFLLGRAGRYEPGFYFAYGALAGLLGLVPFAAMVYAWATRSRTNRKIDAYLAGRLSRHEETISRDRR